MRYHFIQEHHGQFQKSVMFRVLEVSSSAYHRWKTRPASQRERQKQGLVAHINEIFHDSDRRYGSPRTWAGDITYVPTAQGWLYLAVVMDLKSRKVVGWSMRDSLEQTLVHEALSMALGQRLSAEVEGQLLFHSDRGSQ